MATFTKLTLGSKVSAVHALSDNVATTEQAGIDFLNKLYNYPFWVQTFTDGTRKNYAGIGYTYDEDRDAFIPPKTYLSWTLNETTCRWQSPISFPNDGKNYTWKEETTSWDEIV